MDTRLSTLTRDIDQRQKAVAAVGWALANDSRLHEDAVEAFQRMGHTRHVKTAVDPILSSDSGVSEIALNAAFLAEVDRTSAIGKLIGAGAGTMALAAAARVQVGTAIAEEVAEGVEKPVQRLEFIRVADPPTKLVAMVVVSNEAASALERGMQSSITAILASATVAASDRLLVSLLTVGVPTSDATIGGVLAALTSASRPAVIASLDTLLASAGLVRDLATLNIPVIVTPAASGVVIAVDLDGILLDGARVEVSTAKHANVLLDDGGSPTGTTVVNLWQKNLIAIRAERWVKLAARAGAIAWASTGSPA